MHHARQTAPPRATPAAGWWLLVVAALLAGAASSAPGAPPAECLPDSAPVAPGAWTFPSDTGGSAQALTLSPAFPNPFNPSTIIQFGIAKAGIVTLKLYNLLGHEVALLADGYRDQGFHTVYLNSNKAVLGLASGVYFYRLETGSGRMIRKLVLVR